jgi:phosphoribosylaminoimidazole-succinocarboxamide synthase
MTQTVAATNFSFPGQTARYQGKVRDMYSIGDDLLIAVATDRISAFDIVLPRAIPYKGQVLNQLAAHFLEASRDIVPNWLLDLPDPNVSTGHAAEPFKIEMVIRGCLVGHAWREYQAGARTLCGEPLADDLDEYDRLPQPIITPTTKAETGHDEDISLAEAVKQGLLTDDDAAILRKYTGQLFAHGQQLALARGLVLADTKYEFGKLGDQIILIDEVHTPDSSRYFYEDSYETYVGGDKAMPPRHLSKEFVREWLMERGFSGQMGQEEVPELTDEFVTAVSKRYIELYDKLTGQAFVKARTDNIVDRIETNVTAYLRKRSS